jgi:tRNA(Ile)-lysidine synthase
LQGFELIINNAGSYVVNVDSELIVSVTENSRNCSSGDLMIDLNLFPFPWTLRSFKQGDRIVPKGMTGRKKVKDYFIDKKIPLGRRRLIPLLFVGNELLWIAGHCQSEHACKRSEKPFLVALSYTTL